MIELKGYMPLKDMRMGQDKKREGFDLLEYWHGALPDPPTCAHDFIFIYSNN